MKECEIFHGGEGGFKYVRTQKEKFKKCQNQKMFFLLFSLITPLSLSARKGRCVGVIPIMKVLKFQQNRRLKEYEA